MIDGTRTYFFMHVMKTGGTTFIRHIAANFPPEALYPSTEQGEERRVAYSQVGPLRELDPERRRSIRMYTGHLPFLANDVIGADVTLTVLRDPVERTLSILRHFKRYVPRFADARLEEIYDDGFIFPMYIRNYQAKLLGMTAADDPKGHTDVVEVDDAHLAVALANLERVDVLGLNERYDEFLDVLRHEHGWQIREVRKQRVSTEDWPVPGHLPGRIAADNAADVELYERARRLHDDRRRARVRGA